ncbi:pyrokinin-1 receptor-like [Planococcus citri]|uniref:pyrokinin-1 receptor-like n=1 Tax=Planococcus citri TaxID=170843 RepID=UPI0031F7B9C1
MYSNNTTSYMTDSYVVPDNFTESSNLSDFTSSISLSNFTSTFSAENVSSRDSLYIIIPMTLFYSLIFVSGLIGNVSTCIVIFYNKYMHTATNFYLFSLAISDLLLLLSALPKEVYELWFRYSYVFGEVSCVLQGFASESAANATVLTITAFTIERYVAICHPFMSQTVSKLSRAIKHIIVIWLMALCLAIPQAIQFGIVHKSNHELECTVIPSVMDHAFEISSLVFFVIPMCVISVFYILIGFRLRDSRQIKQSSPGRIGILDRQTRKNQTRVIRMLVAVVVAFVICWAPFHAQRLLAIYGLRKEEKPSNAIITLYTVLTYTSGILYYLSATINPILYNIMSNRFRRAFKLTFGHLCRCCISKQKRHKYMIKSRSCYTCRMNHHHQASTPRSSLSQKEEIPLHSQKSQNGIVEKRPSHGDENSESEKVLSTNSVVNNNSIKLNGKCNIKKERSPIVAIKEKLNVIRPITQQKIATHKFRSLSDLCDSKFTEIETFHHSERIDLV